ncbi:MAG: GNAT family N-acetyltransferase [Thermoplasmata archaeon]|nr:MAG: GNAT family N-acetyltransferase [Thermoplasmata archaeon]
MDSDVDPNTIRLETERLILRPLREEDAESIYQHVKEYDIAKWTINIPHPYPRDGAIIFIRQSMELLEKGLSYELAIELKPELKIVGVVSFVKVDKRHKNAELGYWIGKPHWNNGIATEASLKILEFGFSELSLERVFAKCFHDNLPSKRVMEKIGMEYEGKFRHEVLREDRYIDMIYFSILKEDWKR